VCKEAVFISVTLGNLLDMPFLIRSAASTPAGQFGGSNCR